MSEWRPIYTAPKDGKRILVCCVEKGELTRIEIAAWSVTKRMQGWRYDWPLGRKLDYPPACWMPLPPLPST